MKSGIIYLGPEMASKHKIRVNLKIGTRNTRIGVPRELEGWMKTTLYRDNTTLRWILFEDRVAPRHHRQLPDGVDRCVCMLQPARTTIDGVSYMASCRTAMSRGQRRVFQDTNDPETPRSLMEPEFERGNTPPKTRPRSCEELLNDGPIALRRRVEVPSQQLDLTPGELRADQGASITDHWNRSGTTEPRIELVERQQDRERDEANGLLDLIRLTKTVWGCI